MNTLALAGLLMIAYGLFVFFIAATKKPASIWSMGKVQIFIKMMGEMGTRIFFFIWGSGFIGFGVYFLMKNMGE